VTDGTIGLWRACKTIWDEWICGELICLPSSSNTISFGCSNMMAARTFTTIACILSAFSALSLFACILQIINSNKLLITISKGITIASLLIGAIGLAVGIIFVTQDNAYTISVAAIFAIIALIMNVIGVVLTIIIP
jgi:hypothetical protein